MPVWTIQSQIMRLSITKDMGGTLSNSDKPCESRCSHVHSDSKHYHLPKIELPKFYGDPLNWASILNWHFAGFCEILAMVVPLDSRSTATTAATKCGRTISLVTLVSAVTRVTQNYPEFHITLMILEYKIMMTRTITTILSII